MSNDFSNPLDAQSGQVEKTSGRTQPIQIALHLRPVDHSDRAIVANVSAARLSSSMIFLDFGFIEQQALESITRNARAGNADGSTLDGRLECRIAMSKGDAIQLLQQLQHVLASRPAPPQNRLSDDLPEAFSLDSSVNLQ